MLAGGRAGLMSGAPCRLLARRLESAAIGLGAVTHTPQQSSATAAAAQSVMVTTASCTLLPATINSAAVQNVPAPYGRHRLTMQPAVLLLTAARHRHAAASGILRILL